MPEPGDAPLVTGPPTLGVAYRWWVVGLVGLGSLAFFMDISALNIALPALREDLGVSRDEILWVALVPMLVLTGISMTVGRVGICTDRSGRTRWASGCSRWRRGRRR